MSIAITTYQMLIDGKWVNSCEDDWISVENPANKTVFARVPRAKAADVDLAVAAAKRAFKLWSKTAAAERGRILYQITDAIEKNKEKLARLISNENGNALRTQSRGEAALTVEVFRYVAGLSREIKGKTTYLSSENLDYTRREPYGVVGAIVPWNAPLLLSALKIAPALMTGNTIVLKVSEEAPLAVLELARICSEFLPAGTLNVLSGTGLECGAALVEHPDVPKISFTGSTAVGKSILAAASKRVAAVTLELGGKSAQIVFPDVDIDYTTDAGTVVNARQFERVSTYIQEAIACKPEALILGGMPPKSGPLSQGYFFEPTVFLNLPEEARLTREEVFGPVLSVSTWTNEDEVIERANNSNYGLAAFIWSRAGAPAIRVAHALEAGWVLVNQGGGQQLGQSYGGVKQSGAGREFSLEGILESYTDIKQISVNLGDHGYTR
ncbi:MAG: aldehyde dehydrogenase family protein [Sheuella sp.]|nr:aldehyde dehydrogenase family protein [Sheuella sp.]